MHEFDGTRLRQLLMQLAPFRRFVSDNQEPLRRIATNTLQMRWMLPYINLIAPQKETKAAAPPSGDLEAGNRSRAQLDRDDGEMELSFNPDDPECIAQVPVAVLDQSGKVIRTSSATSIRVRVRANSSVTLKNIMAYITKIEKLMADGEWQESDAPDIQTTWADTDGFLTDIPSGNAKYVNILHIDHTNNKIAIWNMLMPPPVVDFVKDMTKYRFTVSVMTRGATRHRIELDWKGRWDKLQEEVRSVP